jgi:hypothetical protein
MLAVQNQVCGLLDVVLTVEQSFEKYGEYFCFVERKIATHDLARLCILRVSQDVFF